MEEDKFFDPVNVSLFGIAGVMFVLGWRRAPGPAVFWGGFACFMLQEFA